MRSTEPVDTARRPVVLNAPTDPRRGALWLLALYVVLYLLPLGVRPMSSPDEVRYGAISHEMITSGDWISPRFNGARYFEKPIMGYWLNSISMSALGENPFALRLPTTLAAGLTALIIGLLTARFAGVRPGLGAAGIYLTTILVLGIGTTAVFDTFLTLFLTAALAAYLLALTSPPGRTRAVWLIGCGVSCGAAFLTKGFLALAIPVLVAAPFIAIERRWRELIATAWPPIFIAAAVIAPWAIAIHLQEPDFWHYFFWVEHIQRFLGSDAQHPQPFWFYFAYAPLIGLPWIWALPASLQGLRRSPAARSFVVYLVCWIILPWLFFSLSRGKLLTYVLPCFPPLAMLIAVGLDHYWRQPSRRWWRFAAFGVATIFLLTGAVLIAAQSGAFGAAPYQPQDSGHFVVVTACLAAGLACALAAAFVDRPPALRFAALGATGALLFLTLDFGVPQSALDDLAPRALLVEPDLANPEAAIVADASTFGAVAWYTKRDDIYLLSPGELGYGLSYPESRRRNLQGGGLADLLAANRASRDTFIIVRPENEAQIGMRLPPGATRTERGGLVQWHIPSSAEPAG